MYIPFGSFREYAEEALCVQIADCSQRKNVGGRLSIQFSLVEEEAEILPEDFLVAEPRFGPDVLDYRVIEIAPSLREVCGQAFNNDHVLRHGHLPPSQLVVPAIENCGDRTGE